MQKDNWFQIENYLYKNQASVSEINYPAFFNTDTYEWTKLLTTNYKIFLEEFESYTSNNSVQPYFNSIQSANSGKWKTLPLITWNIKRRYLKSFSKTKKILANIPGLVSASYSLLEAGGEILEHRGDTDAHIRTHICLYTSKDFSQAAFTVDTETAHWHTGQCLLFCDAHFHSGYNHSNENRLIMIIDVLHPEYLNKKNIICSKVLAGLVINYLLIFLKLFKLNAITRFIFCGIYVFFQFIFRFIMYINITL